MTKRLYYDDSYTAEFEAQVIERLTLNGLPALVLDQSYFYPAGGGQPSDHGWINDIPVLDVVTRPEDREVIHILSDYVKGDSVGCRVDRARRFDIMQQHTGQHILTRSFIETSAADTVAFHLGDESVTIDINVARVDQPMLDKAEDLANQVIAENRPVSARFISQDEFNALKVRTRKIPDHAASEGLRIVDIDGFDITTCGGTHVAGTGEIGLIKIIKVERNGQETRIEFKCGRRALNDYRAKNIMANQLAADLTVSHLELDQAIARLKADLKDARTALKDAQDRVIDYEVRELVTQPARNNGAHLIVKVYENRDPGEIRAIASRIVEEPGMIVLFGISGEKAHVIAARSSDLSHNMHDALKHALNALGTDRGGGRPEFAQGGGVSASSEQIRSALLAAENSLH